MLLEIRQGLKFLVAYLASVVLQVVDLLVLGEVARVAEDAVAQLARVYRQRRVLPQVALVRARLVEGLRTYLTSQRPVEEAPLAVDLRVLEQVLHQVALDVALPVEGPLADDANLLPLELRIAQYVIYNIFHHTFREILVILVRIDNYNVHFFLALPVHHSVVPLPMFKEIILRHDLLAMSTPEYLTSFFLGLEELDLQERLVDVDLEVPHQLRCPLECLETLRTGVSLEVVTGEVL